MTAESEVTTNTAATSSLGPPRPGLLLIEILLLVQLLLLSISHHFWVTAPPSAPIFADGAGHMQKSAAQHSVLTSRLPLRTKAFSAMTWPHLYPPLVFDISALWCVVFRASPSEALHSFSLYLIALGVGAWLIGRAAGGPFVGLATACAALGDNLMLNNKMFYYLDMPMTGFLVLTLGLLATSGFSARRGAALGAGVALGAGFLCKFTMIFILAIPLLANMAQSLLRSEPRWRSTTRFACLIGGSAGLFLLLGSKSRMSGLSDSFESPLTDALIGTWWLWTVLALWLAHRLLPPRARNCAQALLLSGVMVGPWFLANTSYLLVRSTELGRAYMAPMDIVRMRILPAFDPAVLYLCGVGVLAALVVPSKRPALLPPVLALGSVLYLNLAVLDANIMSYYVPVSALIWILAVAWTPRRLGPLVFPVMAALLCIRLLGPMYFADTVARSPRLSSIAQAGAGLHITGQQKIPLVYPIEHAEEVLDKLSPSVRTLAVVSRSRPEDAEPLVNTLAILDMVASWRGSRMVIAQVGIAQNGETSVRVADSETVRIAMLRRADGLAPPEDLKSTPPDAILVVPDVGLTPDEVIAHWKGTYDSVEVASGTLLLRR